MEKEIESIIEEKLQTQKKALYERYIDMYNVVREYITKHGLLLYGGQALDEVLPLQEKIYERYDLPDYDFFAVHARHHAKQLADLYASLGYEYIEVRPGIHYETYKVFVDFMPVADITDIPQRLFDRMKATSAKDCVVPLDFMKMGFHLELSRPNGDISRWLKIYQRMEKMYKVFPIQTTICEYMTTERDKRYIKFVNLAKDTLKEYPILGAEAVKVYLKQGGYDVPHNSIISDHMPAFEIISMNYEKTAQELLDILSKHVLPGEEFLLQHHSALNKSELIPKHITININKRPVVCIYNGVACYSYKHYKGFKIASIDTILSFLYAWLLTKRSYMDNEKILCVIEKLLQCQRKKHDLFRPFELKCYGDQPSLIDLKKARWKKRMAIYRPEVA